MSVDKNKSGFDVRRLPAPLVKPTRDLVRSWCDCGDGPDVPPDRHAAGCKYRRLMVEAAQEKQR